MGDTVRTRSRQVKYRDLTSAAGRYETLWVDSPAPGDICSSWVCHMASKSKLTAPCGVQALATSSGVAPKVENREFYFDNIPPKRSNRAFPMSRHDIRTTYILGLCRLRPETFVTGFDPSGGVVCVVCC